ncbi:MAG: hypothetical protein ACOC92_00515 [bacterium]
MSRHLMTTRIGTSALTFALGLALAAPVIAAPPRPTAVGNDGELFVLHEGAYGDLFPDQELAEAGHPALALDRTISGGETERLLVPGTASADVEDSASILFEEESGTLFILWQTKINVLHSRLNLIGFRGGEWTEPVEISGNPYGWKSSPQFAVARDSFRTLREDGSPQTWTRTVVHLLWWEDSPSGHPIPYYSPVTFVEGEYAGWNPVHRLDDLLPADLLPANGPSSRGDPVALAKAMAIQEGRNTRSATVGFVDPETGWLVSIVLELIPGEITFIADEIRAQIDDFGRNIRPDPPETIAAKTRSRIHELGSDLGLHPGLTRYLADEVHAEIAGAAPSEPISSIADRIRAQIDDFGARLTDTGLDRMVGKAAATTAPVVLQLPPAPDATETEDEGSAVPHKLRLVAASIRSVPDTGREGLKLHLAPNGREALVSWLGDGVVQYRESLGEGWSAPRSVRLGDDLDLDRAHQVMKQRANQRGIE